MSQLLDLSITLTSPPQSSPLEVLATISLNCDVLGMNHTGDHLFNPLTEQEREELRWYLDEYPLWPYYEFAERAKQIEALLPKLGKRLYDSVFGRRQADRIVQKWLTTEGDHQISIISDLPHALSLPWELLHSEQGYLVMRTREPVSILRRLPKSESTAFATLFEPPLRVLLVTARPTDTGFLDPQGLARELLDEVEEQVEAGTMVLEFLRPPTLTSLRNRLKDTRRPVHILHFDGHGVLENEIEQNIGQYKYRGMQGMLAFEDREGMLDLVSADDLAQVLQDSGIKLAVLDACQSAMGASDDAFSSVATRLIQGGIDSVVAMSASVLVASSTLFFEAFYREVAAGIPASMSQERARQALYDDSRRHMLRRRRDEEGQPVELRDWWLPHFYQQRPLELRPTRPSGELKQELAPTSERLSESMPAEPRYGFSGRAYELLQIERCLLHGQLVVMHGFGGVGKTALVRETADWLTRTKMYDAACFVSFEHGGDAATLLSALGTFLGVYDGHYNPNKTKAALAKLEPALKQKHTLVIADNLESILPGGDAPLETAGRTHVWEVLLKLSQMGAGVLLTTRDTSFGDGSMAPRKAVAHLALGGLHPEDAYALASRLLEYLGIDRTKAPYGELRELLKQLEYHPLAIQLVLPALGASSLTLAQLAADFSSLLPRFQDDTETGRNRSLLASLDYSLRRLSQAQRDLLPRLALFEGGASEDDLLVITEIPETEWVQLRPALEQAALLIAEQVAGIDIPFLHFHPVLAPYLRSQPGADDPALRQRYAQRYFGLARYLYREDDRHPQEVRALVQKELPNLQRALDLLLWAGKLDAASEMAECIAMFLTVFGLLRERDDLRRRVNEAVATKGTQESGGLTRAEFLRESGLGDDERQRGKIGVAYTRFTSLLARIEAQPEGAPLGPGSYAHCATLGRLARCLRTGGQPAAAEDSLHKAIIVIEALLSQQPENEDYLRERGIILTDLADTLSDQGKYSQAREVYEEALQIAKQLGDLRSQGVDLGQLGTLAMLQRDYGEAQSRYMAALQLFQRLGEPRSEAIVWHQLGNVAQEQQVWAEAERCYRESLAIKERLGDAVGAASTCNQLAMVARRAVRLVEAEGWWKRGLELYGRINPGGPETATTLSNLAGLLVDEVRAGRAATPRLAEAKRYAEQALVIEETLDASQRIWTTLGILAEIADLEGQAKEARGYRRRERETFAAFEGNRYHIDQQQGPLIVAIAAAAQGDAQAREAVEAALPQLEERGWKIATPTRRIWSGESDWHSLAVGLDRQDALLILRVLETIAQPAGESTPPTPEEVFAALPAAIREALVQGDEAAFEQALEALPLEDQEIVFSAIRYLQAQAEDKDDEDRSGFMQSFESLLQGIAEVASGDASRKFEIEATLDELDTKGWHLREIVQRIWAGERNAVILTTGLDKQAAALVLRIFEMIAQTDDKQSSISKRTSSNLNSLSTVVQKPLRIEQIVSSLSVSNERFIESDGVSSSQPILEKYYREWTAEKLESRADEIVLHYENPEKVAQASRCWHELTELMRANENSPPIELLEEIIDLLASSLLAKWSVRLNKKTFFGTLLDVKPIFDSISIPHQIPIILYIGYHFSASNADELRDFMKEIDHGAKRAMVIFFVEPGQQTEQIKDVLKILRVHAYDIVPVFYKDFEKVIDAKDPRKAFRQLMLFNADLSMISPFVLSGPTPDHMFFGRERELRVITEHIASSNYALIGGRRIGKTSILRRLLHVHLPENGFHVFYHDCSYTPTQAELIQAVSQNKSWFPTKPTQKFKTFAQVVQALPEDKPVVILLDEADKLIQYESSTGYRIFYTLRALSNAGRCHIVFTGEHNFRSELTNPDSPLYNFADEIRIGRLSLDDVKELVTRPMNQLEIQLDDEVSIVQRIWSFTSGHPNVVQRLCNRLITRINQNRGFRLTKRDVEVVIADPDFLREDFLEIYWERATTLERLCSLIIARYRDDSTLLTLRAIYDALIRLDLDVTLNQVNNALERLVSLRNILERVNTVEYRFAVTAFPQVIAEQLDDLIRLQCENYKLTGDVETPTNGGLQ